MKKEDVEKAANGLKKIKCNMVACELYECMDDFRVGSRGKEGRDE